MAIKTFLVSTYEVGLGFKNEATWGGVGILAQGHLVCSGEGHTLIIYGLHPSSPVAAPVFLEATKVGALFVPFAELQHYIDLVRHEKPVYGYLNSIKPAWNSLRTSAEPVGEQEGH